MNVLDKLAVKFDTDKGPRKHGYTSVYHDCFQKLRKKPLNLLEIGIGNGPSIQMWLEYFPNALVVGMDNFLAVRDKAGVMEKLDSPRCKIVVGDQSLRKDLSAAVACTYSESFDIIIDDGSHISEHQQISLGFLFPFLAPGGLYFVEELQARTSRETKVLFSSLVGGAKVASEVLAAREIAYLNEHLHSCTFHCRKKLCVLEKRLPQKLSEG